MRTSHAAVAILMGLGSLAACPAQARLELPDFHLSVVDEAKALTLQDVRTLEGQALGFSSRAHVALGVLLLSHLRGESLGGLSERALRKFRADHNGDERSILYIIVTQDHASRLAAGPALSADLPDTYLRMLEEQLAEPSYRDGHFFNGIQKIIIALGFKLHAMAPPTSASEAAPAAVASKPLNPKPLFYGAFLVPLLAFAWFFWLTLRWPGRS